MAEGVGFEPTEVLPSTVFKTAAFDHSAIPPLNLYYYHSPQIGSIFLSLHYVLTGSIFYGFEGGEYVCKLILFPLERKLK